ncbi:hypothetical protein IKF33_01345 [Candidatus Saccharibacteria bacterium]|nr:hypothetical protein [Candidatus Saccharibacteria bacterium]
MVKFFIFIGVIALIVCIIAIIRTTLLGDQYDDAVSAAQTERQKRRLERSDEFQTLCRKGKRWRTVAIIAALVAALALFVIIGKTLIGDNTDKEAEATTTTTAVVPDPEPEPDEPEDVVSEGVYFFNDEVQGKSNGHDLDFGPDAFEAAKTGGEARDELLRRCQKDPVLLAAVDSWIDVNLGTNLCGVFYEDTAEWRQAVNDYASAMAHDPELFEKSFEETKNLIMNDSKPSVKEIDEGVEDQMFMRPRSSKSEIPTLTILATEHPDGHYLELKFSVKGDDSFAVNFRMECGFQPTNCAEKLNVPVEKKVVSGGGTGGGKDKKEKKKDKPSPKPTKPKPTKSKGDGCKDKQTFTPGQGQKAEKRTDKKDGGGNGHDNKSDPPSGGADRVDQGPGGGDRTPDKPKSEPAVDPGNGMVEGDD